MGRSKTWAGACLGAVLLGGCGSEPVSRTDAVVLGSDEAALAGGVGSGPEFMTMLFVRRSGAVAACHAVKIAPHWALSAAHCFEDADPMDAPTTQVALFGQVAAPSAVRFHPSTFADGATTWTSTRPAGSHDDAFDVALIHMEASPVAPSIRLWHPVDPAAADAALVNIFVGGSKDVAPLPDGSFSGAPVVGQEAVLDVTANGLMQLSRSPSQLEPSDSGGPGFVILAPGMPSSVPFASNCSPTPGGMGEEVLVGINQSIIKVDDVPVADQLVSVYHTDVLDWIAQTTISDGDGDHVCDEVDNCPTVPNTGQENCNFEAESVDDWGHGILMGDACDPAPCPSPALPSTEFQPWGLPLPVGGSNAPGGIDPTFPGSVTTIHLATRGREIRDQVQVTPILADGSFASGEATIRYCDCRDPVTQKPLAQGAVACEAPPFNCFLDPRQVYWSEVPGPSASRKDALTAWHLISTGSPAVVGEKIALAYPGPKASRTWNYQDDYTAWQASGWVAPATFDPLYPPGTDLGGALWVHDDSSKGGEEHGAFCGVGPTQLAICSIADAYVHGVSPDAKVTRYTAISVLTLVGLGDEPWALCPPYCPDPDPFGPAVPEPFVTVFGGVRAVLWDGGDTGLDVSDRFTLELLQALSSPRAVVVPASNDGAFGAEPHAPRALVLRALEGGGAVAQSVVWGSEGSFGVQSTNVLPLAVAEGLVPYLDRNRLGVDVATSYDPRTKSAYLVHAGDGGTDGGVWSRRGETWTFHAIPGLPSTTTALAAVYSPQDGLLWVMNVDGASADARLRRIRLDTGGIVSEQPLPPMAEYSRLHLALLDDDTILVSGSRSNDPAGLGSFALAIVGSGQGTSAQAITLQGALFGDGTLLARPKVARGVVTLAVEGQGEGDSRTVLSLAFRLEDVTSSWTALEEALAGANP